MAVTVTRINDTYCKVACDPAIDGSKEITINYKYNIERIRLIEDPTVMDVVKIYLTAGEIIELHFAATGVPDVTIDGTLATSNAHLKQLIDTFITT